LCHESVHAYFKERLLHHVKTQYGVDAKDPKTWKYNSEVGKIIAPFHLDRIIKGMKEVEADPSCKVLLGGSDKVNKQDLYVCPTIVDNPPLDS
jgi:acyl-CoA reductase-like NAD-dependent aldehyde dehydrogenase